MLKLKSVASSSQSYSYDVFLSFRGEDTRKIFTDHPYKALRDDGLNTFRDDEEIERGESIKSELKNGIQQSKGWIIVFSKNYAFSSWCLDKLVFILECRNNLKRLLLPVFYDIDPSDIRKQSGCISEAFSWHEDKFKREVDDTKRKDLMDKMKRWRTALSQVAILGGMHLQNLTNGYESIFIQKIVNVVKHKVTCNISSIKSHPVGVDASLHAISLWLKDGSTNVEVFALHGIGGVGKTTIAKYVYNMNFQLFEGGSFVENMRESSEQSGDLVSLQRQILSDFSKGKRPTINNLNDDIIEIQIALRHRKLLIVFDDVDQIEQVDAIFGMREWFYQGSKIMLTTRNVQLLNAYKHCRRYAVNAMNFNDSLELFSWHAFRANCPQECYIEHSERIIKQCQGLPLALEVLGASLYGKDLETWSWAIRNQEIIPHCEIQRILHMTYEFLQDDHDRDLFLDLACFYIGEDKSSVVAILDECGYYTMIGIEILIDCCLLKIDRYGKLRMHQLIQSMASEIVRQQFPRDLGRRSRLWHFRDSLKILKWEIGTGEVKGLALDLNMINADQTEFSTKAFSMMHKLRLLKLSNVQLKGHYRNFPKKLKWLRWHGYPLRSLPNDFPLGSLVAIDMQSSKLEKLWQGDKLLISLKYLNLSHCHCIVKISYFAQLFALERLILEDCASLIEIDESIQMAEGLMFLNLKDCKLLKKLLKNLGMLKSLETLIVSGCSNLCLFPTEMRNMESLKVFLADGIDFGHQRYTSQNNESWLEFIRDWFLKPRVHPQLSLNSLPWHTIRILSLVNCNIHDNAFLKDFCVAPSLEYMDLSENPICFPPDCFEGLERLKILYYEECNQLHAFEDLPDMEKLMVGVCPLLEKTTFMAELCHCRKLVAVQTTWTDANFGRRCLVCVDQRCHFSRWLDEPLCHCASAVIIPGLIRKVDNLKAKLKAVEASNMQLVRSSKSPDMLKFILILTWVMIVAYIFSKIDL